MTTFEIIIIVFLYIAMIGFTLENYKYNSNKESLNIVDILMCIILAWTALIAFAMCIHRCIIKFLDKQ